MSYQQYLQNLVAGKMKSENGITLTSLIAYIIGMILIIGIMSVLTTNFYKNVNNINMEIIPSTEFTKFSSHFSSEINKYNIKVLECKETSTQNYIVFDNGIQYTYIPENKSIYQNKIKICRGVESCVFTNIIENGKDVIKIKMKIGEKEYNNSYILNK